MTYYIIFKINGKWISSLPGLGYTKRKSRALRVHWGDYEKVVDLLKSKGKRLYEIDTMVVKDRGRAIVYKY